MDNGTDFGVGSADGSLHLFERLTSDTLIGRHGAGSDPFYGISVESVSRSAFASRDSDGHLDLILGSSSDEVLLRADEICGTMQRHSGPATDRTFSAAGLLWR